MPDNNPPAAANDPSPSGSRPFDALAEARRLMRSRRWGTLATLDRALGAPYASLVSLATDVDGSPLLLISRLAVHTRNLEVDPLCSLLFAEVGAGDPLLHPRVSVSGHAERTTEEQARRRFLARHPDAEFYAGFADFGFWRMTPRSAHLVAGFGRIVDIAPEDLLLPPAEAGALADIEVEAIDHVNADHADAVSLYATRLLGLPAGEWRVTGIDPEGCDLAADDMTGRVLFPERVLGPAQLRSAFQTLSKMARAGEA
jgi:putative heme iron utilization protein